MQDRAGRWRAAALEHLLDLVDAAARTVQLVAQQQVGRAGGVAKAAMDTVADDAFRRSDTAIGQLSGSESGLHVSYP
jgi:hypothetical protein